MKRSIFFIITAVMAIMFGSMMLLAPTFAAENFGLASTAETSLLFRSLGGVVLPLGILNFLVRNEPNSNTLKAILIVNILSHAITMCNDLYGASNGVLLFSKIGGGIVAHLFIGIGSLIFLLKMKSSNN